MTTSGRGPRALLSGHASQVAPLLLGSVIQADGVVVRLTEVEAYGGVGEDAGSHAFRRRTPRNATMFGSPGHLYQYFTYGMHWMLNCVTCPEGTAGAVLLRAGEVIEGIGIARANRPNARSDRDLARGPALLARALGLHRPGLDGVDLLAPDSPVRLLLRTAHDAPPMTVSTRTGVAGPGAPTPWRFHITGDPTVSPHRPAHERDASTPKRQPP